MERVRREFRFGDSFDSEQFANGFAKFVRMYNVRPSIVRCAPDVLARVCWLFLPPGTAVHAHSLDVRYEGVRLVAGILPPGVAAFEGEVDEARMGDW